jgi:quinol monooxygenase YgiN
MERYSDRAALKIHGASEHLQAFFDQIRDLLDGEPQVRVMDELASIEPKTEPEDR